MRIENLILCNVLKNDSYMKKTLPFLKEEYFGNMTSDKILFEEIHKYIHQYNVAPTQQALKICVGSLQITQDQVNSANKLIDELFSIPEESNIKWLIEKTEEFCQDKALYNAIHECIKLADKTNSQNISKNQIPTILKDALAVSFDPNIGHDYFEDLKKRYDAYTNIEDKIPFDLKKMNEITKNGVPRKTLNCIAAETGKGKSIWLCHHAANCLRHNKNVLYITLEMSEYKIAERIDANLMNITIEDLQTLPFNLYEKKLQSVKANVKSKLIIKEYPTASANAMHFRHLLDELKLKLGFVPDVIMVDYINICASSKYKTNAQTNSYTLVKSIAEELRALAIEQNVAIWTATQLNRCLDLETVVQVQNKGNIQIKDISIGDSILGDSGYNTVEEIYENEQDVYEIELENGYKIICSSNHVFPVENDLLSIDSGLSQGMYLKIQK